MKQSVMTILLCMCFPFFAAAKAISSALHLEGVEDMPTLAEWFNLDGYEL